MLLPCEVISSHLILGEDTMINDDAVDKLTLKGTTTIGVTCNDGVILASDTRVSMGYFVAHKHGKKIYKIDDHLAMTIAGTVADAQRVVDILIANVQLYKISNGRPMSVSSAARFVANLMFSNRYVPLETEMLIGGLDDSGPHVFRLDPFGTLIEEKCVSTGSGSPMAYGVLDDKYKEDAAVEELLPVVVKAVDAAMKRNAATGDNFNISIIDKKGYRELTEKEKKKLIANQGS
jgi:proteasome beta subunit